MKNILKAVFLSFLLFTCSPSLLRAQVSQNDLDCIASYMLTQNRIDIRGRIIVSRYKSGGVAAATGSQYRSYIYTDPYAMRIESANTWAFILGHELGHIALRHTTYGASGKHGEFAADVWGARLAMYAGYNIYDYLKTLEEKPNYCSRSHGCWSERIDNLKRKLGVNYYGKSHNCNNGTAHGPYPIN